MRTALFVICAPLLFGQLETNTVTITASRSITVQPDQAVVSVGVSSALDASFDDVVAALQGTGITAAQFAGFSTTQSGTALQFRLMWNFTVPVQLADLKRELAALAALQQSLGAQRSPFGLGFAVAGTQASPQLLASQQCSEADLVADARTQTQTAASAAGFTVGQILSLSKAASTAGGILQSAIPVPVFAPITGDFNFGSFAGVLLPATLYTYVSLPSPVVSCSLTVKFRVTK
jgi:hypothetical protein